MWTPNRTSTDTAQSSSSPSTATSSNAAASDITTHASSVNEEDAHEVSYTDPVPVTLPTRQEILLLVAPPASGKSTLALSLVQRHPNYVRVNRDELGSLQACLQLAEEALRGGKSVVVDNTNINNVTRATWVKFVAEFNRNNNNNDSTDTHSDSSSGKVDTGGNNGDPKVSIRCLVLEVPKEVCMQLALFRVADPQSRPEDLRTIETVRHAHAYTSNKLP